MIDLTFCPECGQPAEVLSRSILSSTDGPIEHARVFCVRGHYFFLAVESLPRATALPAQRSSDGSLARRDPSAS